MEPNTENGTTQLLVEPALSDNVETPLETSVKEETHSETPTSVAVKSENVEKVDEEYAYLDRGGFSSEKYKIEVRGLPKFYGIAELKKLMNLKLGLSTSKLKRPKHGSKWLYACFQNEEDRAKAIEALNGFSWKGKELTAHKAEPAPDPFVKKRKLEGDDDGTKVKKVEKCPEERLKDAATPYWNIPYEEQLKIKEKEIRNLLMKLDNDMWKSSGYEVRREIESNRKLYDGLSFKMAPIERSPITEGYRNKCEFTVGIDEETSLATVGLRFGSYATGTVAVAPVESLAHISREMKTACLLFQDFVRSSGLAPFSPADYSGHWKQLTVRQSRTNKEIMLIAVFHRQNMSEGDLEELKRKLVEHFSSEESKKCNIVSLYYEIMQKRRVGDEAPKPVHLMGSTHITDTILGRTFRISPQAFFQINTWGTDVLYQTAIDMCRPCDDATVIDICCGTGTIGICFSKHCHRVLGVDFIAPAIEDAKFNAKMNDIDNCEFFVGKAEDVLQSVLARAVTEDVVAVVDPPRAGLHSRAITQLRNTTKLSRVVYISCSPASALNNFRDLVRPASKTLRGAPFRPVAAAPVDLFPHTSHCELVVLFERRKKENPKPAEVLVEQENEIVPNEKTQEGATDDAKV